MKRIYLIIILFIIVSIQLFGQLPTSLVDTLENGADTIVVRNLWGAYSNVTVVIENLGTGEDTLVVHTIYFIRDEVSGAIVDTVHSIPWMKDYAGSNATTLLVPEGAVREFILMRPGLTQIEVFLTTLEDGNTRVIIEAWKGHEIRIK